MLTPKKKSKKGTSVKNYGYEAGKLAEGAAGKKMKTGGMANSNTKASKTAVPKAMYGTSMRPGMMKKGGTKKK